MQMLISRRATSSIKMASESNPLGMRSLSEAMRKPIGEQFKEILLLDWIFNKGWEKAVIIGCLAWTFYSIVKFVISLP